MGTFIQFPGSGEVPTYPDTTQFPFPGPKDGALAIALDTNTLYIWDEPTVSWLAIGTPGAAIAIDGLSGDVLATGPGVVAATVNSVGGSSASDIHTVVLNTTGVNTGDAPDASYMQRGEVALEDQIIRGNKTFKSKPSDTVIVDVPTSPTLVANVDYGSSMIIPFPPTGCSVYQDSGTAGTGVGNTITCRVYAYRDTGSGRVYSQGYDTVYFTSDASIDPYSPVFSVGSGDVSANGHRFVIVQDSLNPNVGSGPGCGIGAYHDDGNSNYWYVDYDYVDGPKAAPPYVPENIFGMNIYSYKDAGGGYRSYSDPAILTVSVSETTIGDFFQILATADLVTGANGYTFIVTASPWNGGDVGKGFDTNADWYDTWAYNGANAGVVYGPSGAYSTGIPLVVSGNEYITQNLGVGVENAQSQLHVYGRRNGSPRWGAYGSPVFIQDNNYTYVEINDPNNGGNGNGNAGFLVTGTTGGTFCAHSNAGNWRFGPLAAIDQGSLTAAKDGSMGLTMDHNSGFIGVGNSSPAYGIHVITDGNANQAKFESSGGDAVMYCISQPGDVRAQLVAGSSTNTAEFGTESNHDLTIVLGNVEVARYQYGSGSFGLGTPTPSASFEINKDTNLTGIPQFRINQDAGPTYLNLTVDVLGESVFETYGTNPGFIYNAPLFFYLSYDYATVGGTVTADPIAYAPPIGVQVLYSRNIGPLPQAGGHYLFKAIGRTTAEAESKWIKIYYGEILVFDTGYLPFVSTTWSLEVEIWGVDNTNQVITTKWTSSGADLPVTVAVARIGADGTVPNEFLVQSCCNADDGTIIMETRSLELKPILY